MPVNVKSFSKAKSSNSSGGGLNGLSVVSMAKKLINDADS